MNKTTKDAFKLILSLVIFFNLSYSYSSEEVRINSESFNKINSSVKVDLADKNFKVISIIYSETENKALVPAIRKTDTNLEKFIVATCSVKKGTVNPSNVKPDDLLNCFTDDFKTFEFTETNIANFQNLFIEKLSSKFNMLSRSDSKVFQQNYVVSAVAMGALSVAFIYLSSYLFKGMGSLSSNIELINSSTSRSDQFLNIYLAFMPRFLWSLIPISSLVLTGWLTYKAANPDMQSIEKSMLEKYKEIIQNKPEVKNIPFKWTPEFFRLTFDLIKQSIDEAIDEINHVS